MLFILGIKQKITSLGKIDLDCNCGHSKGELKKTYSKLFVFFLTLATWNEFFSIKCEKCNKDFEIRRARILNVLTNKKVGYYDIHK